MRGQRCGEESGEDINDTSAYMRHIGEYGYMGSSDVSVVFKYGRRHIKFLKLVSWRL